MSEGFTRIAAFGDTQLNADEVHVWQASLDVDPPAVQRFSSHLSAVERERAGRFVSPTDASRFTVCRGILRDLLGGYLQRQAASIGFETGPRGKPALKIEAGTPDLHFNLSNSHGVALYAFALRREVGVDVEKIRPEVAFQGIENRYFSSREQQELRKLPDNLRAEGFFSCWTRKEAYIKARGEGLHLPLDSFDVSLTPGEPAVLNSVDRERWSVYSLQPRKDFAGALVVEGNAVQLKLWELPDPAGEPLEFVSGQNVPK
jgi:4'-phosphopantetheinyl transferase